MLFLHVLDIKNEGYFLLLPREANLNVFFFIPLLQLLTKTKIAFEERGEKRGPFFYWQLKFAPKDS